MELLEATTLFMMFCITCLLFFLVWRKRSSGSGKLPPGPVAFPILGNVLQLKKMNLLQYIEELSRTYGPIFTICLGSERVVVLFGYETVKEALKDLGDAFTGRGSLPIIRKLSRNPGILLSNGERWKKLRRFALTSLRNFGMGKKSLEERIQGETRFLVERFRNTHEQPFDPSLFLTHTVSNIICSIIFGEWFDYKDEKFLNLIHLIVESDQLQRSRWTSLYNCFPALMDYLPGPHKKIFKNNEELRRFVLERVKINKESLHTDCPRDFIDNFLIKLEEQKNSRSEFNLESLTESAIGLFFAGTAPTSTTLNFGLLIFLKYPEIEAKVHKEIDHVIGRSRSPCMADQSQMPYTDAVVHEIQRFLTLSPLSVPRATTRDVGLKQYIIPKGTTIFPVLKSVLYDSTEFPNPEQFNPGHFLDEKGAFKKSDYFMPFSTGKRNCLGKGVAQMELFLVLTTILQNFTLKPLVHPKDIDITPITSAISNAPKPYQLCVLPR